MPSYGATVPPMERNLWASRIECGGCCHCQGCTWNMISFTGSTAPALIRTPERSSHLGGAEANSLDTAAPHLWTRTPSHNIAQKVVLFLTQLSRTKVKLRPSFQSALGGARHGLGFSQRTNGNLTNLFKAIYHGLYLELAELHSSQHTNFVAVAHAPENKEIRNKLKLSFSIHEG